MEPGLILDDLRDAAEKHHLTFGPDPSTHTHCVLGGMIGNNSGGEKNLKYGKTARYVEELDVVLAEPTLLKAECRAIKDRLQADIDKLNAAIAVLQK